MASHIRTCKVLSQFLNKQTSRALLLNRGRIFISTSAIRPYGGRKYLEDHGAEVQHLPIKTFNRILLSNVITKVSESLYRMWIESEFRQ